MVNRANESNDNLNDESLHQTSVPVSSTLTSREHLLLDLVTLAKPLSELLPIAQELDTSYSAEELITICPQHIQGILQLYLTGAASEEEVCEWSNLIELHPLFVHSPTTEEFLRPIIFDLANPSITGKGLTSELAVELLKIIDSKI